MDRRVEDEAIREQSNRANKKNARHGYEQRQYIGNNNMSKERQSSTNNVAKNEKQKNDERQDGFASRQNSSRNEDQKQRSFINVMDYLVSR